MRTKTSIEIYNYWESIRGTHAGPVRSQIEPSAVRYLLPELFILEAGAEQQPMFRLAGTRICSMFGRELRNLPFSTLWPLELDKSATGIAAGVMEHAIPALLNVTGFSVSGRHIRMEMVLMPVRSSGNVYDRLLGSLTPETPASWLGSEPLECLTLERSRLIGPGLDAIETGIKPPSGEGRSVSISRGGSDIGNTMRRVLHLKIFEGSRA